MNRFCLFAVAVLLCSASAFAQSNPADSQALQSILAEIHQLRQEMRTTTIAAQRVQILLYRLQSQEAAVARSTRRLDEARSTLQNTQNSRKEIEARLKQFEDAKMEPALKAQVETAIPMMKTELETLLAQEPAQQLAQSEAEEQLRIDQAKLSDLQAQLSDLDKQLDSASLPH